MVQVSGVMAFAGGLCMAHNAVWQKSRTVLSAAATGGARRSLAVSTTPAPEIILYQYKICPFCNGLKAFMDYFNLPYRCVEVNPTSKEEIKTWSPDYKKVPIVTIDGRQVNDSLTIIDDLVQMLVKNGTITASESERFTGDSAKKWTDWSGKTLAVLLFPNITRNFSESWQAFAYVNDVPHFDTKAKLMNRYLGPVAMWAAQGKIKKKYNIDDEREELYNALKVWTDEIGEAEFHGGTKPALADLYAFGTIRALDGLDTHTDILADDGPLKSWYESMARQVGGTASTGWE